jgi:branched-chain amino acid aminotransferase
LIGCFNRVCEIEEEPEKVMASTEIAEVTKANVYERMSRIERPWTQNYLAMYSSLWQGVTLDPDLMWVPADDHMVHRGDAVFDAMRCVDGSIYQFQRHLLRLKRSADAIELPLPMALEELSGLILEVVRRGGEKDTLIRVSISRGPGGSSTNPYECHGPQLYINVIRYNPPPKRYYEKGANVISSKYPQKDPFFANIKSCNYLLNVLMKKEAIDSGVDYAVGIDKDGCVTEGSTENIMIFTQEGHLVFPPFDNVLTGTTALRVKELSEDLVKEGIIKGVLERNIKKEELFLAKEIFLTGTSINVMPVTRFDGVQISNGRPGELFSILNQRLLNDMYSNRSLLTPVFF